MGGMNWLGGKKSADKSAMYLGVVRDWRLNPSKRITQKYYMPIEERSRHMLVIGTTGSGKSRLIEKLVCDDIKRNYSVVVLDPKGDFRLVNAIFETAEKCGRLQEVVFVSPVHPTISARIDPLKFYRMKEEITSHIVSTIQAKDDYYITVAQETTQVIIDWLIANAVYHGVEPQINIQAVKRWASHANFKEISDEIKDWPDSPLKESLNLNIEHIVNSPQDFFAKVSSSLRTVLTALTSGAAGLILGRANANRFLSQIEQGGQTILVVQTGSMLTRRVGHMIGRMVLSMIQSLAGRLNADNTPLAHPLSIYMDEAGSLLYRGVEDIPAKSASAGIYCHFFTQSLADLEEKVGPNIATAIKDNCNTQIYMRVNDLETGEYISRRSGMRVWGSHMYGSDGHIMTREVEEPVVLPHEPLELLEREFFLFNRKGALYKGRVEKIPEPNLIVKFPEG